jgi:outer membrane biosynthesis protein TonB
VPGAVIATRRYADGSGGKMASQMPDGKSHYHTGIALTRPDASGNVLIFDQAKSYGSKITKVNINDYHGETWGVVKGGEPTSKSMEAVNIALSRANESEKVAITESMRGSAPKTATSTGQLEASVDVGPVPTRPMNQEGQPLPPQQQAPMQQPGAPQQPAPQVKADAPPPAPKIQPVKYKFNEQTFLQEVRAKSFGAGLVSDEYIMGETLKGFKETAGVKYDRKTGTLTIDDPNSPAIKEIVSKMRENNLDEKVFLNKMKEEKPTPPPETKPKEQKPVAPPPEKKAETPAPQAPQTPAPTPPAQAPAPTPTPEPPKVEAKPQEPPKVPGASDGGLFNVGDRNVAISPMDKRDDKAVIDTKTQQPLFTVKSGESINVTPQQKVDGIAPGQDNIRNEINALRQEMGNSFADAGGRMSPVQMTQIRSAGTDNPNFVDNLTKQNVDMWNNPVMERAMNRTRLQETGDPLNNHFSYGNTNG